MGGDSDPVCEPEGKRRGERRQEERGRRGGEEGKWKVGGEKG